MKELLCDPIFSFNKTYNLGPILNISSTPCYYTFQCPLNSTCTKLSSNAYSTCECSASTYPNPTAPVSNQCG